MLRRAFLTLSLAITVGLAAVACSNTPATSAPTIAPVPTESTPAESPLPSESTAPSPSSS